MTSVTCGDRRFYQDAAVRHKNERPTFVNATDTSATICQCSSRKQIACDDSGIVVEAHGDQQQQQHSPTRTESRQDEATTDERTDLRSASPAAADARLDVTSAERRRSGRHHSSSAHHWYRHRRRASNERRAMERVAEWIDRNCGSRHDDRPAVAATASLTLRMPEGGKLMLIVDSRPSTGRRLHRHCDVPRHFASGCRLKRVDLKDSEIITLSGQPLVVELAGLKQR